jgi:hypothetical protein
MKELSYKAAAFGAVSLALSVWVPEHRPIANSVRFVLLAFGIFLLAVALIEKRG